MITKTPYMRTANERKNFMSTPNVSLIIPSEISLYKYLAQSTLASIGITPFPMAFPKLVPCFSIKNSVKNQLIHIGIMIQNISGSCKGAAKIDSQCKNKPHNENNTDNTMLPKLINITCS